MSRRRLLPVGFVACSFLLAAPASGQSTRYVDDSAAPGGDGQTWTGAYQFLQDALTDAGSNAAVTEIRVAGGTYRPDRDAAHPTTDNGIDSFSMRNNLAIRGGYAGLALPGTPDVRDLVLYQSSLRDGWPVILAQSVDRTAVLEGVRVSNGIRGMRTISASPTIRDCLIEQNLSYGFEAGAGVQCEGGAPIFVRCAIRGNEVVLYVSDLGTFGGGEGGGCHVNATCAATFVNCIISGNVACPGAPGNSFDPQVGNGGPGGSGGGIYNQSPNVTLTNCVIAFNRAGDGGNGAWGGEAGVNGAGGNGGSGGGLYSTVSGVQLVNCTVYGNTAGVGGLASQVPQSPPASNGVNGTGSGTFGATLKNTILASNTPATNDAAGGSMIASGTVSALSFADPNGPDNVGGNADDDFHIVSTAGVNAGDNSLLTPDTADLDRDGNTSEPTPRDLDGKVRIYQSTVDLGAYEQAPNEDCNSNGTADFIEISEGTQPDCDSNFVLDACQPDCNTNGTFDGCEFAGQDCNLNQHLDICEPDCNTNYFPDSCDLAAGADDCNTNQAPDECEFASGALSDCDLNTTPDQCELSPYFVALSPNLTPFDVSNPQMYHLTIPPAPTGPVTITIRARTRLATTSRWVDVYLGTTYVGQLFVNDGTTCPPGADTGTLVVSLATFEAARVGNDVDVRAVPNANVVPPNCASGPTFVSFTVSYGYGVNRDCNTNGVPDTCDVFCGDLDYDGDVDGGDFSLFLLAFGHSYPQTSYETCADMDADRTVTLVDYQRWLRCYRDFIGAPTAPAPQPADMGDLNADGRIDADDIQPFVEVLLGGQPGGPAPGLRTLFVADFSGDAAIDPADVPGFVDRLRGAD